MTDPGEIQRRIIHGFQCLSEALRQLEDPQNAHRFGRPIGGVLGHLAGAADPHRELAARVGISDAAAEEVIDLLVTIGLVESDPSGHLILTPQGERLAAPFREKANQYAMLVESMTPEHREQALASVQASIRALQEDDSIRPSRLCASCRYFRGGVHGDGPRPHHCQLVGSPLGNGLGADSPPPSGPRPRFDQPTSSAPERERARTNWSATRGRWTRGKA